MYGRIQGGGAVPFPVIESYLQADFKLPFQLKILHIISIASAIKCLFYFWSRPPLFQTLYPAMFGRINMVFHGPFLTFLVEYVNTWTAP